MKIVVTGANGFLGTNLIRELVNAGETVKAFVRPSAKLDLLKALGVEIFSGAIASPMDVSECLRDCDAIVHAASTTTVKPLPFDHYKKINVDATENIVRQTLLQNKRLVYVSTANAFAPGSKSQPGDERRPFPLLHLDNGYINSKYMAQQLVLKNVKENNLNAVVVNPTFMIGPYDSKPSSGKIILMGLQSGIQWCPPGGKNFVAVADVAKGIHNALTVGKQGECYLLAGENLTYKEFFSILNNVVKKRRISLTVPRLLLYAGGLAGDAWNNVSHGTLALTRANVHLLGLDNYYSAKKAQEALALTTSPIEHAVEQAIAWFKKEKYVSADNYSTQGTNLDL